MPRIEFGDGTAWLGEDDTPAPLYLIDDPSPLLTIGVSARYSGVTVVVRYRFSGSPWRRLAVRRGNRTGTAQYFSTRFPKVAPGARVEYEVLLKSAGLYNITDQRLGDSHWFELKGEASKTEKVLEEGPRKSVSAGTDAASILAAEKISPSPRRSASHDETEADPDAQKSAVEKRLSCLKHALGSGPLTEKLDGLYAKAKGSTARLKSLLEKEDEFDEASMARLEFANELADLTDDDETLVNSFLGNGKTHCIGDIALNVDDGEIKSIIAKTAREGDSDNKVDEFRGRLFRMAPAAVVHRMARNNELEVEEPVATGLLSFFEQNPELDFKNESVLRVLNKPEALDDIPQASRDKVIHSLKCCQRLSSICPTAETVPKLMRLGLDSAYSINEIPYENFVAMYADALGGEEIAKRVHDRAQAVTVRNEHALISLRDAVMGPSVNMVHAGHSPADRKAVAVQIAQQNNLPINFETLFGSVDLCECKHCNSVYSPAAYLVELFQYLRNNNLDPDNARTGKAGIKNTPLKKLFRRRPDLGRLQFTCENTHTLIPYIDLVNEVMESFVVNLQDYELDKHKPKQAKITAYNVEDESSEELIAEPRHTTYKAYRKLKNAVYPVCKLPYHQPVDATRQYLNFLDTSRHELISTFRRDVNAQFLPDENVGIEEIERLSQLASLKKLAVDRAIDAEYLGLVEEEYVILTKEGFQKKEWYELKQQENLTAAQYQNEIGLKSTWEYYGIDGENQMLAELKWVKPATETGVVGFLRRVNILYVDLIELLKTRYVNPNYPSGKALAFLNSLPYSYRYLQTLVDESETDLKLKYRQLIELLQSNSASYADDRFDKTYIACWVYTHFKPIGELIVLEDTSSCTCVEGTFRIFVLLPNVEDGGAYVDLAIDHECRIYKADNLPKEVVGHLETASGKLVLNQDFLDDYAAVSDENVKFQGKNGEKGFIRDWTLYIGRDPFSCGDYYEHCDIAKTQLKHLDGSDLRTPEYDRMHSFIRLWCKLGWTMAELDQAISGVGETVNNPPDGIIEYTASMNFVGFQPSSPPDDDDQPELPQAVLSANLVAIELQPASASLAAILPDDDPDPAPGSLSARLPGTDPGPASGDFKAEPLVVDPQDCRLEPAGEDFQEITPYLIEQLVAVKQLREITGLELSRLLVFWTVIGTAGEKPLYRQLFLKHNLIAVGTIFQQDEYGTYLTQGESISDHLPVLMAAIKTDVAMLEKIMAYAGIADEMTLPNVSHIYRHLLLTKSLGLRANQLPALFELLKDQAHPFSKPSDTLEFYRLFERIVNSGFDTRALNYMIRGEDDPERPLKPETGDIFQLAVDLRDALFQIEVDHADIDDDAAATEELLREKLSLIFDGAAVEQIIGLVQGNTAYGDNTRRRYSTKLPENDQASISAFFLQQRKNEAENPGGEFQTFLQRVQFSGSNGLQVTGILSQAEQTRLIELADLISDDDDREKFLIAVKKILGQPSIFFDDALAVIFPQDTESARAVLVSEDTFAGEDQEGSAFEKRAFLMRAFLPYLREQLRRRQVVQMLASKLGLDQDVTAKLVMEVIETDQDEALYQEIIRLAEQHDPLEDDQQAPLIWQGFFVPEQDGYYTFLLEAEGDAALSLDHRSLWTAPDRTDEEQINFFQSPAVFLKGGHIYPFLLEGYDEDDAGNIIGLFLKLDDKPQRAISDNYLFPALRTESFMQAYIRLQKAAMLLNGFAMELKELEFFLDFPDQFEAIDFNSLSFPQWMRLEAFFRLRKELPEKALGLIEFLRWSNASEENAPSQSLTEQINQLTGWEKIAVDGLIKSKHFNLAHPGHFRDEKNLLKLKEALQVAEKIGVGIDLLFQWGKPASRFSKTRNISGAIREAIRARYQQDEWEEAIKPVNDQLRENQKQALIAYLLAQPVLLDWGVRDADSLFEFFLIDVQMDACMETSRIKQAISSVQLFVQRGLLGLEKDHGVAPKDLDRTRWEWMSHYRVWEANRKVFLYPENWIRGELRDDKSPFFQQLESELLQNDISDEAVKGALTRYIVQVDEVSNLEVIGEFLEGDRNSGKLHVVARTRNSPYFFYYRYYLYGDEYWYPWEKVEVDIPGIDIENDNGILVDNGCYAMPAAWKGRLFIIFPQFMKKTWNSPYSGRASAESSDSNTTDSMMPLEYWEIKMSVSEYKEGKWTPKQTSNRSIQALTIQRLEENSADLDFYRQTDKFIFALYLNDSSANIRVQVSYVGNVTYILEGFSHSYWRYENPWDLSTQQIVNLEQSFRFDGSEIRIGNKVTDATSFFMSSLQYSFHKREDIDGSEYLLPIQSESADELAVRLAKPMFYEEGGKYHISSINADYRFFHPKTGLLLKHLRQERIDRLFGQTIPLNDNNYGSNGGAGYHELKRPYALYNWEILFHAVAMLAEHLSKSQRFEESMKCWHYIFDPINVKDDIKKVWKFLPFRATDSKNALQEIFKRLDPNTPDEDITQWRENPFMPHVIARERTSAYMKWVVMKYIDNLIAWGDALFRQDTIETINQATQLYVLAGHILGPRPEMIPQKGNVRPQSYLDLVNKWDAFSNAMVDLELIFPFSRQISIETIPDTEPHYVNVYGFATSLYFCIPDNPKLLEYWDTVADRLFKIRHCQNIEGVFRKLNLFEPPIDPALLVQARAQGLSIGSILSDLSTPTPNYRFNYLLARALEVTAEVKSLGGALLSVLEKKDAESLSLLRAKHDINIQTLILEIKNLQLEEAQKSVEALQESRKAPVHRLEYYSKLAGEEIDPPDEGSDFSVIENTLPEVKEESGVRLIGEESEDFKKAKLSRDLQIGVGAVETLAGILALIPGITVDGKPIGIGVGFETGGQFFAAATRAVASGLQIGVNITSAQSVAAGKKAGHLRQMHERIFQANSAGLEIKQIDKQIWAQDVRRQIAEKEIENHQVQIDQSKEIEEYLKRKFSNERLYHWMSEQLKDLYYRTYSFAYDLAKKAEKVYRFDMGLSTSDFVKFGYWDSSKEGFLTGEQLYLALKRLEIAYIETKPHDYEITKHISLRQINPLALIELKELGICEFNLPEELFDLDYPGHYKRRIKTVAVSIPCIVGPSTSINCTLRLLKHEFRNSKIANDYPKKLEDADERFVTNPIPTTAIAVSQGQNDSGVFELSFQSERYLPFEGAGAISSWRLELAKEFRQFDYQTITDVVFHLRYTSCEGGDNLKSEALTHLNDYVSIAEELSKTQGLFRMFSLPHEFPNEWHRLLNPASETEEQILYLGRWKERFPFFAKTKTIYLVDLRLFLVSGGTQIKVLKATQMENIGENPSFEQDLEEGAPSGNLHQYLISGQDEEIADYWGIQFAHDDGLVTEEHLNNAWLVAKYSVA